MDAAFFKGVCRVVEARVSLEVDGGLDHDIVSGSDFAAFVGGALATWFKSFSN